jgi:hypothetical protein
MAIPSQHAQKIRLNQRAMPPTKCDLAGSDAVLLILPTNGACSSWQALLNGKLLQRAGTV